MAVGAQGRRQGAWNRRARGCAPQAAPRNFRVFEGRTPAPQGRRRQAPQDRRRLTFFWGWAEIRRSRLWPLEVVLDELRVHAAQYKTRPSQAEHVAGRAGLAEARGASQLLGNRRVPGAGTAGSWNRRGGPKCTNCRAWLASYLEPQGIDPPERVVHSLARCRAWRPPTLHHLANLGYVC